MEPRHIREYAIDEFAAHHLFGEGNAFRCMNGWPEGARVLGVFGDFSTRSILIQVEHPSFEAVQPGTMPRRYRFEFSEVR